MTKATELAQLGGLVEVTGTGNTTGWVLITPE